VYQWRVWTQVERLTLDTVNNTQIDIQHSVIEI